ncbi:MAG: succinate dehydrogenase/fumarate reductase iron-sulfur subunit [Anaerolineaceae bacterium]|nr:succinate dehydrogenase/fumarate reductase iron-sulfur subunit [Anaerolineaceae bacterium]|tara:strand:+ start:632 stop:1393 length:762 start_codon:yes stop_codon:yes gene_type:complete
MSKYTFQIWRGNSSSGEFVEYKTEVDDGMVVLDVLHRIQAQQAGDMALRWNCKAGKCGSCGMEVNGKPQLACMTRMNTYLEQDVITVQPLKTFPVIKDLVCDVSWNYDQNLNIKPFKPGLSDSDGRYRMSQEDVDRVQEFRKCIECYLCQDVCHVLRDHNRKDVFVGPRFMIRAAGLDMHPLDVEDRIPDIRDEFGSGYCNITRCCTDVCPENITITDNAIIPLKERVADRYYDPIIWLSNKVSGLFQNDSKI